jgi:hypothetical protein
MYGYPPDLFEDATRLVLRQADLSTTPRLSRIGSVRDPLNRNPYMVHAPVFTLGESREMFDD